MRLLILGLIAAGCFAIIHKPVPQDPHAAGLRLEQIRTDGFVKMHVPPNPGANVFVEQTELPDYAVR